MTKRDKDFIFKGILLLLLLLIVALYLSRHFRQKEIDDVTPGISCEKNLLEKSDVLWVIPLFENNSIANNKEWCASILSLNKTLELHGVYHTFDEFGIDRDKDYVDLGTKAFEDCFGFRPEKFKAPQQNLSSQNKLILEEEGFKISGKILQLTHKVYHCGDTGLVRNKFIDLF